MSGPRVMPTDRAWFGNLPAGWGKPRLRRLATIRNGCDHKHAEVDTGGYPVYGSGGQFARCRDFLHPGPSVLLGRKGTIDNPQLITDPFWTVDTSFYTEIAPDVDPRFFYYVCKNIPYDFFEAGTALPSMTQTNLYSVRCPLPPLPAQRSIADYLDSETAHIDSLIDRKTRFIDLLLEKRTALITHAVTKGLDPDVDMKDSGVAWIGAIPSHWKLMRLRHLCDVTTGGRDTVDALPEGDYPFFVRSQNVEQIDSYSFDGEAVLTAGDGAGVAKVFHYFVGKFDYHQRVYAFTRFRHVSGQFFFHFIRENFYKVALDGAAKSTVDSLRRPMILDFWMTVPPSNEQEAIVEMVESEATATDILVDRTRKSIELLSEYRTALISAAVTGQIEIPATDPGEDVA